MRIEYILLEILLGAMLLGFIGAYKKRLFDRIVLFLTVPVAFAGAVFLAKSIVTDSSISKSSDLIGLDSIEGMSDTLKTLILTVGEAAAAPIVATVAFWILLPVLRIVIGIVLSVIHLITGAHRREKEAKRNKVKKPLWNRLGTGLVGALSGFVIVMLSMLPLVYINNMIEPAVDTALAEENDGSYVSEVAHVLKNENLMPLAQGTLLSKIRTVTGMSKVTDSALDILTDVDVTLEDGKTLRFNLTDLVAFFAKEGVGASVVYESSCKPTGTMKDLSAASPLLMRLAENDEFISIVTAVYGDIKLALPDLNIPYDISDGDALRSDITAAADLVKLISTDLASVSIDSEDLISALLEYIEDTESSKKLVNTVAASNIYKTNFPTLTEYALKMLCDGIDISKNKSDDYERFIASLAEVLNDRSIEIYDRDAVEVFIEYCALSGIKPSDYAIADINNKTNIDLAYISYVEFITRKNNIEEVFTDYRIDSDSKAQYFVSSDTTVYVFDEESGKWTVHNGLTELCDGSYAAQLLSHEVNRIISSYPDTEITDEILRAAVASALASASTNTNLTVTAGTLKILSAVYSEDYYTPDGTVYREDILNALDKSIEHDKAHNDSFGTALSVMARLYGDLSAGSDDTSSDAIVDSFDDIGRLLDCMKSMKSTKDIPDMLLLAIMQNKSFGDIFETNAAKEALNNLRSGESTYEEFFTTIQGIYGIINEIVPS